MFLALHLRLILICANPIGGGGEPVEESNTCNLSPREKQMKKDSNIAICS